MNFITSIHTCVVCPLVLFATLSTTSFANITTNSVLQFKQLLAPFIMCVGLFKKWASVYFLQTSFTRYYIPNSSGTQVPQNTFLTFFDLNCMYICSQTCTHTHIITHTHIHTCWKTVTFRVCEKSKFQSLFS